jgi:predicted nucleic acid-binding protein
MPKMLYLDVCCWNRPFDDQSESRVRLEAEAVLSILEMAGAGRVELVGSAIIDNEIAQMPDAEHREKVELLVGLIHRHIPLTAAIERRAAELQKWNISPMDALHFASAEAAHADCLLTTDDYFLRRAYRHADELKLEVENPAKWLIQLTTDES